MHTGSLIVLIQLVNQPQLVDSVDHVFVVPLTSLDPQSFRPLFPGIPQAPLNVGRWVCASVSSSSG